MNGPQTAFFSPETGVQLSPGFSSPVPLKTLLGRLRSPIVGRHIPVPLFKKRYNYPGLTFQHHCPWPQCAAVEACQPKLTHNIQKL